MADVSSVVVDQAGNVRRFRDQGDATYAEVVALGSGDKVVGSVNITGTVAVSGTVTASPTGTQAISGTVTAIPSGVQEVSGSLSYTPSGTTPVSGTVTIIPSGTQAVSGAVSITGTAAVSGTVTTTPSGTQAISGVVSITDIAATQVSSVVAMALQSGAQALQAITCASAAVDYSGAVSIGASDLYMHTFCSEIYQVAVGQETASDIGAVIGAGLNWATPVKVNANSDANIIHARTLLNSAVVYVSLLDNIR